MTRAKAPRLESVWNGHGHKAVVILGVMAEEAGGGRGPGLRGPCMPGSGDIMGLQCPMIMMKLNSNIGPQKACRLLHREGREGAEATIQATASEYHRGDL